MACAPQTQNVGEVFTPTPQSQSAKPVADSPASDSIVNADPALWVVKDEDTTVYLFGTVHILKPEIVWFDGAVRDAFDDSDQLVLEMLDVDPADMIKVVNDLAIDKTGVSLRDKLEPADRADYEAALSRLEVPAGSFDPLEPWFASVTMSLIPLTKKGYDTNNGVEGILKSFARGKTMDMIGLETPQQQLGFFDNLPEDVQIRFLNYTVDTIDEAADGMDNMVTQWANGNVSALAELMNAGLEEKILYDTLLVNRNANWANWIENRMDMPGTVFVAVGAGHLAGEGSVQDQLAEKGYVSTRIKN